MVLSLADDLSRVGHESEHVETLATNFLMLRLRSMKKMKGTRKKRGIRRTPSLPKHTRTTSLISQMAQKLMTGGTESLTDSGRRPKRWMPRNRLKY